MMTQTSTTPRVFVTPYDPQWPAQFAALREHIWPALHDIASSIEHVGSTSVPGLAAKPIIDLDVIVSSPEEVTVCVARLAALGYAHRGELGIAGRHAFKRPEGTIDHHLYVCVEGTLGLRNHLILRDYLRARPEAAQAYGALKQRLAALHPDNIDAYVEGKTSFIVAILEERGLDRDRLDEVVASNRAPEPTTPV